MRDHVIFLALINTGVSTGFWLKMISSVLITRVSGVHERQNGNGV